MFVPAGSCQHYQPPKTADLLNLFTSICATNLTNATTPRPPLWHCRSSYAAERRAGTGKPDIVSIPAVSCRENRNRRLKPPAESDAVRYVPNGKNAALGGIRGGAKRFFRWSVNEEPHRNQRAE